MPAIWIPKRLVEIGLINTAAENPTSFVCHCEIEYESRVIAAAAESRGAECKVIMLTGPSASGKTTTANKLAEALIRSGTHAVVISLDNFYKDIEDYPRLPDGSKDYENVHALDVTEIHRCLTALIQNGEAEFPVFDFVTERRKVETQHIALERSCMERYGLTEVNVHPVPTAGGAMAACAWEGCEQPVAVESIGAHAGIDIGNTLIGMHLRAVVVPVRPSVRQIGAASVVMARTRPKYIGGPRAHYDTAQR